MTMLEPIIDCKYKQTHTKLAKKTKIKAGHTKHSVYGNGVGIDLFLLVSCKHFVHNSSQQRSQDPHNFMYRPSKWRYDRYIPMKLVYISVK